MTSSACGLVAQSLRGGAATKAGKPLVGVRRYAKPPGRLASRYVVSCPRWRLSSLSMIPEEACCPGWGKVAKMVLHGRTSAGAHGCRILPLLSPPVYLHARPRVGVWACPPSIPSSTPRPHPVSHRVAALVSHSFERQSYSNGRHPGSSELLEWLASRNKVVSPEGRGLVHGVAAQLPVRPVHRPSNLDAAHGDCQYIPTHSTHAATIKCPAACAHSYSQFSSLLLLAERGLLNIASSSLVRLSFVKDQILFCPEETPILS
ncbi:hypothetical protein GQ53DRAFT_217779 [Thozetella sp. PMI_491]|nr:hypothetical protein GQ53DRAFT_217779 [Thozetella sp. PMI_491]